MRLVPRAHRSGEQRSAAGRLLGWAVAVLTLCSAVLIPAVGAGAAGGPSISGTVWSASGGSPMGGIDVSVYAYKTVNAFGHRISGPVAIGGTTTADDGTYTLSGLKPSPKGGYFVCFTLPSDFPSTIGVCWADQFWFAGPSDPFGFEQLPFTASSIKLRGGQHLTGIDADMVDPFVVNPDTAGSISGTVTHADGRRPLAGAVVTAFNDDGLVFGQAVTGTDGTYRIDNLLASAGPYTVCFDGDQARAGFPPHRFGTECWNGVPWGTVGPPADAAPVAVTAGENHGSINADLRA